MADDEQFSLCWNNFNSNLSAGFHESLCRGDLVDVTLAAEGQFVKAHRLVLSVCSPYFRKMFTQMPANQHAFVFLKDVSHTALKDLIQFMYCGEVNVKQEALPAFISTAEALQIKGLTDSDPPQSQTPPEPSTPTPQVQQIATSPRIRQRNASTRSTYKIESLDDSSIDEQKSQPTQIVIQTSSAPSHSATIVHHAPQQIVSATPSGSTSSTVLSHKRNAQRTIGPSHIKRNKTSIETIDVSDNQTSVPQQITVQTAVVTDKHTPAETEYIDLPIELPTKSEPEYTEETTDVVEAGDQDGAYGEDDSYGDIRYDESYFTENEDGGPSSVATNSSVNASGPTTSKAMIKSQSYSDSSYVEGGNGNGDQTSGEAQVVLANDVVPNPEDVLVFFTQSLRGRPAIMANGVRFLIMSENKKKILWRCSSMATKKIKCPARITMLKGSPPKFIINKAEHIHAELKRNKYGTNKQPIYSAMPAYKALNESPYLRYEEHLSSNEDEHMQEHEYHHEDDDSMHSTHHRLRSHRRLDSNRY